MQWCRQNYALPMIIHHLLVQLSHQYFLMYKADSYPFHNTLASFKLYKEKTFQTLYAKSWNTLKSTHTKFKTFKLKITVCVLVQLLT